MFSAAPTPRLLLLTDDEALRKRFFDEVAPITRIDYLIALPLSPDAAAIDPNTTFDLIAIDLRMDRDTANGHLRHAQVAWPRTPMLATVESAKDYLAFHRQFPNLREFIIAGRFADHELHARVSQMVRRQYAKQLAQKDQALLEALMENVPDRIYFKDRQSRFVRVNQRFATDFGFDDPDELVGKTDFEIFTVEHAQPAFDDEMKIIETGEPILAKIEKESFADSDDEWVSSTKLPLRDADGVIVGTMGISRVVTDIVTAQERLKETIGELRDTQQQLVEAEKMKTVGRMAASIAHEVKNPLGIISMGLQFLNAKPDPSPEFQETMEEMSVAVQRAADVISELLDFSSPNQANFEWVSINDVVEHSLRLLGRTLSRGSVGVEFDLSDELPPILADSNKMEQVFLNLILNARNAMPKGGKLAVRSFLDRVKSPRRGHTNMLELFAMGEEVVVVEIEDTGPGIPEDLISKVFEPFVTTHKSAEGTGLGLTVTKHIMDLHHGAILLENKDNGGLRARLLLPIKSRS